MREIGVGDGVKVVAHYDERDGREGLVKSLEYDGVLTVGVTLEGDDTPTKFLSSELESTMGKD